MEPGAALTQLRVVVIATAALIATGVVGWSASRPDGVGQGRFRLGVLGQWMAGTAVAVVETDGGAGMRRSA
jgi:hypothetical protein